MLLDPDGNPPGGFVCSGPILKDTDRGDDIAARVQGVIRHEARQLAQDRDEPLINLARDFVDEMRIHPCVPPDNGIRLGSQSWGVLRLWGFDCWLPDDGSNSLNNFTPRISSITASIGVPA